MAVTACESDRNRGLRSSVESHSCHLAFLRLSTFVGLFGMFSMSAGAINVLGGKFIGVAASQTASTAALKRFMKGNSAGVFTLGGSLALGMLFGASQQQLRGGSTSHWSASSLGLLSVSPSCSLLVISLGPWFVGMFWDFGSLRVAFR